MNPTLNLALFLFSPIAAGAALRRLGFLRPIFNFLRIFTTWVILPLIAFVYVSALVPAQVVALWGAVIAAVMGVAACFFASCLLVSRLPKEEGVALVLNSSFMNVAHLGLPVIYAKLGSTFMPPAVLYAVTVAVLNLFLGTLLMHFLITKSPSLRQIFTQTFTFPAVALLLLALLLVYLRAPLPQDLYNFFTQRIFPAFLLLLLLQVGYHLRIETSRKYTRHLPVVGLLRLLLCPLVTLATCHLLGLGESIVRSSLYLSLMPPSFFNLILAQSLELDPRPYSLTIFVLTLLSFLLLFL
jgi:predicted permease